MLFGSVLCQLPFFCITWFKSLLALVNYSSYLIVPCLTVSLQIFEGSKNVNVSHIIHDLSFGPKYPGIHNPLDGTERILHDASGTFKYYIKVWIRGPSLDLIYSFVVELNLMNLQYKMPHFMHISVQDCLLESKPLIQVLFILLIVEDQVVVPYFHSYRRELKKKGPLVVRDFHPTSSTPSQGTFTSNKGLVLFLLLSGLLKLKLFNYIQGPWVMVFATLFSN